MTEINSHEDLSMALDARVRPPMANGEVLFDAPWHGRVFGMAVALHEAGVFAWSEFQAQLIEVVGVWDSQAAEGDPYEYYQHFQTALQRLMAAKGLISDVDLDERVDALAARPHGHDH